MNIVVTGSLGNISSILARELIQKGHRVTVISSNADRQKDIEALGAKAAIGSIEDVPWLANIFTGADTVYCMMPPKNFVEPDYAAYGRRIGDQYAQAIRQSGVGRVVHLSSWGAQLDKGNGFIIAAYEVEKKLDELADVALTHVRPVAFYTNLLGVISMIKRMGFIASNYGGDDPLVVVAAEDIATAVAEELSSTTVKNKIRYVASDERTCREAAQILGKAIGHPELEWRTLTDEERLNGLEAAGVPPHVAVGLVEIGRSTHNGAFKEDYDRHRPVLGRVKLEEFAQEFANVYNQK